MSRPATALAASLILLVSHVLAGCDTADDEPAGAPADVTTTVEDTDTDTDTDGDEAAAEFESATASIEVSGDIEGPISMSSLRSAEIVDGIFTATIASTDPGQVLQITAPDENESATTGAGQVALSLEIATEDGEGVATFVAGEGTCTITMAPTDTAVQGTFECSDLTSEGGDLTIDASGSFAVNRS